MPEFSVWIYVILLTLLDAAVKSQVSLHDRDASYLQTNNEVQYIVDKMQVPVHNERAPASTLRVKSNNEEEFEEELVYNTNLKFIPPVLDFKERCLGIAHHEKVVLMNESANKTVHMSSISGGTSNFHSSFFQDRMVPPRSNTSFSVVFLGRAEGLARDSFRIHTSEGIFKYQVQGVGVSNLYRLRPLVGLNLPINSTLDHHVKLYNPNPFPIQLMEVYSKSSDIHLELPSGEQNGPKQLWELPPFCTKTVINIHFKAKTPQNFSTYVRFILNHTSEMVVIPLEMTVRDSLGLYLAQDGLDFGMSGSSMPPTTLPLMVHSSAQKPVFIESIESSPPTKAIKVNFKPIKISPDSNPTEVATVTLNWQEALSEGITSGTLVLKGRSGQEKLSVKWRAKPLEGGLSYQGGDPLNFVVRNDYRVSVAIVAFQLQGYPDGDLAKGLQNLHSKKLDLEPKVLAPGESTSLFRVQNFIPPHSQFLIIHTNISTLNQTLPLSGGNGKLTPVILSHRYEDVLDLGLVSRGEKKYAYLALLNLNRDPVDIKRWRYSHSAAEFQLLGIDSGKLSIPQLLARTTYGDYNRDNLRVVKPGHYAVFRLYVEAPKQDGLVEGEVFIETENEDIEIAFRLEVAPGTLEVTPDSLVLDNCFPGMRCETPFHLKSTFAHDMAVTGVVAVPPNPCLLFTPADPQATVAPFATTQVGLLGWDASRAPSYTRYLGLQNFSYTEWTKLLSLPQKTFSFDKELVNKQWKQFQNLTKNGENPWNNISLQVDTNKVRNLQVKARVRLSWPRLAQAGGGVVMFPLTQVGNTTSVDLEFVNNAAQPVLLQLILEQDYPAGGVLTNNIPRRLLPSCSPCMSKNRKSFSMDTTDFPAEANLDFSELKPHPSTVILLLKPAQSAMATFKFHPSVPDPSSALLFIRNNLTMLEVVRFTGTGMAPQFRFGKRKPGSKTPLLFEYVVSQLADCERISPGDPTNEGIPGLTIKRSFSARNSGDLPIFVSNFLINGVPCEGFGFHVLDCQPFQLEPNASRLVDIAFTPDLTLSRVERTLTIETSMGFAVNYSLVSTLPAYLLASCSAALSRPAWEPLLYYSVVSMMVFLLFCVVTVAYFESNRVLRSAIMAMSCNKNVQPTFNLKDIDSGVVSPNGHCYDSPNSTASNGSPKWDHMPSRATFQDTSSNHSKGKKKKGLAEEERSRRQKEKENGVPSRKPRWAACTPSFNSSEDFEGAARSKNCPIHDANFWNKSGKKEKKQKKKGNKTYCSCPSFEDETSSTTTESSNNDEDKEHVPSENGKLFAGERKLSKESVKKLTVSCRNAYEDDESEQPRRKPEPKSKAERQTPSPHEEKKEKIAKSSPHPTIPTNKLSKDEQDKKQNGDIPLPPPSLELPYKLKPLRGSQSNPLVSNGLSSVNLKRRNSQPKNQLPQEKAPSSNKSSSTVGWSKVDKGPVPVSYSTIARFGTGANEPAPSRSSGSGSGFSSDFDSAWPATITKKVPPPPGFSELDRTSNTFSASDLGPIGTKRTDYNPLQLFIQQMRNHQLLQHFQSQQSILDLLPSNMASQYSSSESSRTPGSGSSLTVTPPLGRSMTGTISPTASTASDASSVPSVNSLEAALSLWETPPSTMDPSEPVKDKWSDVNSVWPPAPKPVSSETVWGPGSVWPVPPAPNTSWTPCEENRTSDTSRDSSEGLSFDPFRSLSSIWSPQNPEK